MLYLLLIHLIVTVSCFLGGLVFYRLFPDENRERSIVCYLASGLILLTGITQIVVLFFPVTIYAQLCIPAILALLSFNKIRKEKYFIPKIKFSASLVLFLIFWAIILLINAGPVIMDDTESYHIQSIKWIQEYGPVPGLVNLHERFGFNSSWFSSVALFSFLPSTTGGFTALNSVLSLWFGYWCLEKYNERKHSDPASAVSILSIFVICLLIWPLVRGNSASANYDFITTLIVLFLFTEIVWSKKISPSIEWVLWPVYLITVRIINFPLLILSMIGLVLLIRHKNSSTIYLSGICCLFLIIPFIARNILISGYPFYPATLFDWVAVDWKPDPGMTERLLEYIKYYNRISTTYSDIEQTKALGAYWIPSWFKYLFFFDKMVVIAGFTGIFLSFITATIRKIRTEQFLGALSLLWLLSWLLISPDPRFVYGILLYGIFLLVRKCISNIRIEKILPIATKFALAVMITASLYYFITKPLRQKEYRNWISPAELPQPQVKELVIEGIKFRIPNPINNNWNARCYGTELPCLYTIDPRLRPRGTRVKDGFRLEK